MGARCYSPRQPMRPGSQDGQTSVRRSWPKDCRPTRPAWRAPNCWRAATSVAGDPGGRDRLEQALVAAEATDGLDTSAPHALWVARGWFMFGHNDAAARLARRAVDAARRSAAFGLIPQALGVLAAAD